LKKKKKKTFIRWAWRQLSKIFLVLFFKKEHFT